MFSRHEKAKLLGRPYRGGYEGEGAGGGWGDWGGGGDAVAAAPAAPAAAPAAPTVADSFIGSPVASLTGGNLSSGNVGFGFAAGPMASADADAFAGSFSGVADSELVPLDPVTVNTPPVALVTLERTISVDVLGAVNNVANFLLGLLAVSSGTAPGVIGGSRAIAGVFNSPSVFSETMTETVSFPGATGAAFGSNAPAVVSGDATGAATALASFAGVESGMAADSVISGAPVLGFDGGLVNNAPQTTTAGSGGGVLSAIVVPASPRGQYAAPGAAASSSNSASPLLALAGVASLLFMG